MNRGKNHYVLMKRPSGLMWTCRTLHVPDSLRAALRMDRTTLVTFDDRIDAAYLACRYRYRAALLGHAPLPPYLALHRADAEGKTVEVRWAESPAWVLPPLDKMKDYWHEDDFDIEPMPADLIDDFCAMHEMGHLHLLHGGVRAVYRAPSERTPDLRQGYLERALYRSNLYTAPVDDALLDREF